MFRSRAKFAAVLGIVALVIVELVLQLLGFGAPLLYRSGASAYEPRPGQAIRFLGHATTINSFGTRGRELAARPAKDTARILLLGDSVVNGGLMIDDGDTISARLEQDLRTQGCHAEVLNASAGGWSIQDEAAWIKAHGLFASGKVVLVVNGADLFQQKNPGDVVGHHPSVPGSNPPLAFVGMMRRYVLPRLGIGPSAADAGSGAAKAEDPRTAQQVRATITALQRDLARQGVSLAIAYHRSFIPMTPQGRAAEDALRAMARDQAIPFLDLGLPQTVNGKDAYRDAIHPTPAGNRWMAATLAQWLRPGCGNATANAGQS